MAYRDLLGFVKFAELTDKQREVLKRRFLRRKQNLEAALEVVEQALVSLAKAPAAKKTAKRRAKRATKK
jgi:hypothetical protein